MKTINYLSMLLLGVLCLFSCDERDFDVPPFTEMNDSYKGNITILDFIKKYEQVKDTIMIADTDTIEGYVVGNDVGGNVYKQLVIQDATAALVINIDQNNMGDMFPIGQKLVINCRGFYVGHSYEMFQMGGYYKEGGTRNPIGRIEWVIAQPKIFRVGAPNVNAIVPDTITAQNYTDKVKDKYNIGKLFYLKGVSFLDGGVKPFATENDQNRVVQFGAETAKTITLRNSAYADFAKEIVPTGTGNLLGVLTSYQTTTIQFLIRTIQDVIGFSNQGNGTKDAPWTIEYALDNQDGSSAGWIEGHIVGTVAPGYNASNPITSNEGIIFDSSAGFMNNTLVLASSADVKDYSKCVVVNLPSGSDMRSQLNLQDNPANLGKSLKVKGTLTNSLGIAGLTVSNGSTSDFVLEGSGPTGGDGSEAAPYSVVQAKANQGGTNNTDYKWVTGYVVGVYEVASPNNIPTFTPPFSTPSNLLLADTPDETDLNNCIPVQVPNNEFRDVLSPVKNPSILKQKVDIKGSLEQYFSLPGIKNLQAYKAEGGGEEPEPGDGDGDSSDKAYTIAQGMSNQAGTGGPQKWIKGYIVGAVKNGATTVASAADVLIGVSSGWDSYTNVLLADSPEETNYTKCIVVNLPSQKALRTNVNLFDNPGNYKKKLTVKGVLRTYFSLPGLRDSAGETADFILE